MEVGIINDYILKFRNLGIYYYLNSIYYKSIII